MISVRQLITTLVLLPMTLALIVTMAAPALVLAQSDEAAFTFKTAVESFYPRGMTFTVAASSIWGRPVGINRWKFWAGCVTIGDVRCL